MKRPSIRICVLGSEAAGKTCLLGGLGVLGEPGRSSPFQIHGADAPSTQYLNELARTLHRGRWPSSTPADEVRQLDLQVLFRGEQLQVGALDYAGETLRKMTATGDDALRPELVEQIDQADVIVLLFDREVEFAEEAEVGAEEADRRLERLKSLLKPIMQRAFGSGEPPEVALVLTKADRDPELAEAGAVKRFFRSHPQARVLDEQIRHHAPNPGYFAISAVGHTQPDPESGRPVPGQLAPKGYASLFAWILRRRRRREHRWWIRPAAVSAAVLCLILILGGIGWDARHRDHIRQIRDFETTPPEQLPDFDRAGYRAAMDWRLEQELERVQSHLDDDPTLETLQRLQETVGAFADITHTSLRNRIETTQQQVEARRRELRYRQVESAWNEGSPWSGFRELATEFLQDHPGADEADQVRQWSDDVAAWHQQQARLEVTRVSSDERGFLLNKARAIEDYLDQEYEDPDREAQQRAARLARRLHEKKTFTLRLERLERLDQPHRIGWTVEIADELAAENYADGTRTVMTGGDDERYQIQWSSGDSIRIAVHARRFYFRWYDIAWTEVEDALSIAALGRPQELPNVREGWRDTFHSGPTIRFSIEGYDEEDWQVLRDWVHPGGRW